MERTKIGPQIMASLSGSLVLVSFGFHVGWPSPALPKLLSSDSDIPVTTLQCGWIVGISSLGGLIGTALMPYLADGWGRKMLLLVSSVPYVIGCIVIAMATNHWMLYAGRVMVGVATGISGIVSAMYIGEITEDRMRGTLGAANVNFTNLGLLIAYCVGPWVDRPTLAGVGAVIAVISGLIITWMPESPYFLLMKKKRTEARKSLVWLRGIDDVNVELNKLEVNVALDQKIAGGFKDLVATPGDRKALLIAVGLFLAQELSGYVAVVSYSSLVFEESGAKVNANLSVVIVAIIQLASVIFGTFLADRVGRRPLLLISASGSIVFLSGEAIYFQLLDAGVDVEPIYWLPVTAIVGYLVSFSIGLGVLPTSMSMEILSYSVRAKGAMITVITITLSSFFVAQLYPIMANAYGVQYPFWLFAAITVFSLGFIYFVVPETKDRSFRDIQDEIHNRKRSRSDPVL